MTIVTSSRSTRPTRMVIVVFWSIAAALMLPLSVSLEENLDARARVSGSEAQRAERILEQKFDTPFADPLILVVHGVKLAAESTGRKALAELLAQTKNAVPGLKTVSYLNSRDPLFLGAHGTSTIVLFDVPGDATEKPALIERLRQTSENYFATSGTSPELYWTSESLVNDELRELSARDANRAEIRVLPLAILVLLIAFGSATAGLTPIAIGFLTVAIARGALALIDNFLPLSVLTANVAAMLGLALSVDYALLIVSRFREELVSHSSKKAAIETVKSAGAAVFLSGFGVAIALAALLFVPINEVRSIGIAGLVVVAVAVAVCLTLLPVVLSIVGARIDILLSIRRRLSPVSESFWRFWARAIFARPLLVALLAAAPLLVLASQTTRLDISLPRGDWLPGSARAAEAMDVLDRIERTGFLQTLLVIVQVETPGGALSEDGWRATANLASQFADDPRVEATRTIANSENGWKSAGRLPEIAHRVFLSHDKRLSLIVVVPRADMELYEYSELVRDLRATPLTDGIANITVGGTPALTADYIDAVSVWFMPVALGILVVSFFVLLIGLRSVLLPLKAIVLNLLSVAAALGAMTVVFQDGVGSEWLGLSAPTEAVFPIIPILVFSIVFGLSMDYEVFLFSRVVEKHRDGASDLEAMIAGLSATASVITSAAGLMVIVFGAFMLGDFLLMKMLGFSLAAAILIDALLIRLILGPALFALAGRWNWWPFFWGRSCPAAA